MDDGLLSRVDVAVVGLGAVGRALARALEREGSRASLRLYSRRPPAAAALSDELSAEVEPATGRATPARLLDEALHGVRVALLCVRDGELGELARAVAACPAPAEHAVLLHTSGYFGEEALRPAAEAGWQVGALHPLRAFRGGAPHELAGTAFVVGGDGHARVRARQLAGALGGRPLELVEDPAARARYHAAAALLSNGLVALFDAASELFGTAVQCAEGERREALAHLLESTLAGLGSGAPEEALTGPVARGDADVVAGHLSTLADRPELLELYRRLSLRMVELARRAGRVEPARLDAIAARLTGPPTAG